jgi:hypothetical protein
MKLQAFGWLAAGVLAAGLNASYHDGGMQWAHRAVNRIQHRAEFALALATGHLDQFVADGRFTDARIDNTRRSEARLIRLSDGNFSKCRLSLALAQAQRGVPDVAVRIAQFDRMSAQQQAQLDRLKANRIRIENQLSRIEIPAIAIRPAMVKVSEIQACPRVHVNVPRVPQIKIPAMPEIHIEMPSAGPV